jgi:hypothetical protein
MNAKLLIVTIATLSVLGATVADAASRKQKREKMYRSQAPVVMQSAVPRVHSSFPMNRPAWTTGSECYTDDGYGRFLPCDLAKSF